MTENLIPDFNALNPPQGDLPPIIGLSGYARSGKDTVGSMLTGLYGYHPESFASTLKAALYLLNPMIPFDGTVRALVDHVGWDEAKTRYPESDLGIRALLQRIGTEVGRDLFGEDFWVEQTFKRIDAQDQRTVITDVRFINEAMAIKDRGGLVVRIERPGVEAANDHPSETALDDWNFDHTIFNDRGLTDLQGEIMLLLKDVE